MFGIYDPETQSDSFFSSAGQCLVRYRVGMKREKLRTPFDTTPLSTEKFILFDGMVDKFTIGDYNTVPANKLDKYYNILKGVLPASACNIDFSLSMDRDAEERLILAIQKFESNKADSCAYCVVETIWMRFDFVRI